MDSHFNKVLITGINGFTGVHLEKYLLRQGYDVYGTVINPDTKEKHLQCDITKKAQLDDVIHFVKPDYVIHIAAISFVGESDASLIYDVNVIGTENLLQSLLAHNVKPKKVILASSATVYGNQGKEVLDESMCPKPVNHYGISKLAMERVAENYFSMLNIIITRPFNYTGVGQESHFLIPKIVEHFKKGKKVIELGNIHVSREFNDVNFVCEVYDTLLQSNVSSEIVNIASGRGIKLLEVIDAMNTLSGYEIKVEVNPAFVRKDEIKTLTGSVQKISNTIGTREQKPFKETLKSMLF